VSIRFEDVSAFAAQRGARICAFQHVSFIARPGEIVALIGANGSGKTSLLKVAAGLTRPSQGTVVIGEATRFKTGKGKVTPFYAAIEPKTTYDFLPLWLYLRLHEQVFEAWQGQQVSSLLEEFNLPRNRAINAMSRGEAAKAHLLCALGSGCPVQLLDEPFEGLDEKSRSVIARALRRHCSTGGTVLCSVHRSEDVLALGAKTLELT
jgi:ABC-2 type transport system ATP-binding protein